MGATIPSSPDPFNLPLPPATEMLIAVPIRLSNPDVIVLPLLISGRAVTPAPTTARPWHSNDFGRAWSGWTISWGRLAIKGVQTALSTDQHTRTGSWWLSSSAAETPIFVISPLALASAGLVVDKAVDLLVFLIPSASARATRRWSVAFLFFEEMVIFNSVSTSSGWSTIAVSVGRSLSAT